VKILRREKFYRVKTDYLATDLSDESKHLTKQSFASFNNQQGGILINITINQVHVFNKSLKEIEEFFSQI
jgi:hypothetical protein